MGFKDAVESLKRCAAAPWFPVLVGMLNCLNCFLLVLSGPLVILFCSAVLANRRRWLLSAFLNAAGTTLGCLILVVLVDMKGVAFIKEAFPSTFQSKWWGWTEGMMQHYGGPAMVPVAAMPIIVQPLVFFGKLTEMNNVAILLSILIGRTIKYSIMAQLALLAPGMLKFFGAKKEAIESLGEGESKKQ